MNLDIAHFKNKLESEAKLLETELEKVGQRNPDNLLDWEATSNNRDTSQADANTVADSVEDYGENVAIVHTLESRYQDIKMALDKIVENTYGLCEICQNEIGSERLEANPSAHTCQKHMN
jgi:DnaK suppressor protein